MYSLLKEAGYIVAPGIKFGTDFAVYEHGPGIDHAPFIIQVEKAGNEITAIDMVRSGRLATTVRKQFIIAVVDEDEGEGGLPLVRLVAGLIDRQAIRPTQVIKPPEGGPDGDHQGGLLHPGLQGQEEEVARQARRHPQAAHPPGDTRLQEPGGTALRDPWPVTTMNDTRLRPEADARGHRHEVREEDPGDLSRRTWR